MAKKPLSKENKKTLLLSIALFIVFFIIYQVFVYFELIIGMWLYLIASCLLLIAFVFVNRGFSIVTTKEEDLPSEWSKEEKSSYLEDENRRHKIAKKIMLFLMPIAITLILDIINIFFFDNIKEFFTKLLW